ncbi:MAG: DUF6496 domain-containing protein [Vicinamibacterales bacterium]
MAKYGRKAGKSVARAVRKQKGGTLRSGGSGRKVTSRKQAIAIGLSEAREAGAKVPKPRKKTSGTTKKSRTTKSATRTRAKPRKRAKR